MLTLCCFWNSSKSTWIFWTQGHTNAQPPTWRKDWKWKFFFKQQNVKWKWNFYKKNTTKYNRNRKLFFQEVPVESRYFWNVFSRWRRAVIKTEIGPGNTNIRQNTNSLPDELSSLKEIPLRISSSNANIKAKGWEWINNSHNLGLKLGYPTPLCPTFAKLYFRCYVSKSPIGNQKSAISMEGDPIWTMSKSGIELRSHIKEYVLIKQGQKRDSVKS